MLSLEFLQILGVLSVLVRFLVSSKLNVVRFLQRIGV